MRVSERIDDRHRAEQTDSVSHKSDRIQIGVRHGNFDGHRSAGKFARFAVEKRNSSRRVNQIVFAEELQPASDVQMFTLFPLKPLVDIDKLVEIDLKYILIFRTQISMIAHADFMRNPLSNTACL